ncbi:ABC transporter permease [Fulvivirga sp. M361]|uniref:ABC transporter permease n=1 Tax=Fulvivirga sp. M361 TaxID=2594266 RepID=UPI00117AFB09|nr:ABC transporter permease [Fulvivirga sp. M361]TRX50210.1 ABC transporter permease [Fulvivirga sp. M361]
MKDQTKAWDMVIQPKRGWLEVNFRELWRYRDLLYMFVKRDVITIYKQTVLGPIWFVIQPILTAAIFILVFGNIAGISTDGQPKVLFYLSGIVVWNYFSESFSTTSKTFIENANVFGKVYFPRLIVPFSKVVSGLIKFLIQFAFFFAIYLYFLVGVDDTNIKPNEGLLVLPLLILIMALLGLGLGIIFSALTTKYRDLTFLIQFGVQLLMYATPVIYPVSTIPEKYKKFIMANPMTSVVEGFRYAFLGTGDLNWYGLSYSLVFTLITLFFGIIIFNRVEKNFMDTV